MVLFYENIITIIYVNARAQSGITIRLASIIDQLVSKRISMQWATNSKHTS